MRIVTANLSKISIVGVNKPPPPLQTKYYEHLIIVIIMALLLDYACRLHKMTNYFAFMVCLYVLQTVCMTLQ